PGPGQPVQDAVRRDEQRGVRRQLRPDKIGQKPVAQERQMARRPEAICPAFGAGRQGQACRRGHPG
ncbi:hypothetical protein RZS08_62835, partial [Arthrospira platensis SPKY1]|nr:hypothetical protein [Arthrospira platensis SPKY1]